MAIATVLSAPLRWSRRLYDWVLRWGASPHALTALFLLALAEASFFPVPPDALLIALCMGAYWRWKRFAVICSLGSVIGGVIGYAIGYFAFELVGQSLLDLTAAISGGDPDQMLRVAQYWFDEKEIWGLKVGPWAVGVAGFTPIPYKVFTIASGFFKMTFAPFVLASVISRSLRFFLVAGVIGLLYRRFGERIEIFIDRWFNWLAIAFVLLLVGGFVLIGSMKAG